MQTEAVRGEWLVEVQPALPTRRGRRRPLAQARAPGRSAIGAVLALAFFAAGVLAAAVALAPIVYTPLF
jgi:hypothetical protein